MSQGIIHGFGHFEGYGNPRGLLRGLEKPNRRKIRVKALETEDLMEDVVSIPHGCSGEANVNLLTDVHCREPIVGYPQMKSQLYSIRKA